MPRIVRIATSSLATLEDVKPPYNLRHLDPSETMDLALSLLEAAGQQGADRALLPETFAAAGLPSRRIAEVAEPIPGRAFDKVAACAARHRMNVVAGFFMKDGGRTYNVAALIDRNGRLVGTYSKKHPTGGEIDGGVTPRADVPVVATDVGRIGLAICFDINWQPFWTDLKANGAELVCWLSAYEGGFPLQAYAWLHQYAIVSSVWPYHAKVIERTGRILTSTSRWGRLGLADLNLDKHLFHTDGHYDRLLPILARYGKRVRIETLTEEHLFTLESTDPELDVEAIIAEFGLTEFDTFIGRCTEAQQAARSALAQEAAQADGSAPLPAN